MLVAAAPKLEVELAGRPLPESRALVRVEVRQQLDAPSQCEVLLEAVDADMGALGQTLEVYVGPERLQLFRGAVTARERTVVRDASPRLRLRAYDPLWTLRRTLSRRVHVSASASELLAELTRPLGLAVHADEAGPSFSHLLPHAASDLELLERWCGRAGLHFFLSPRGIELFRLSRETPAWSPREHQLVSVEIEENEGVTPEVTVLGWHPRNTELLQATTRITARNGDERYVLDAAVDGAEHAEALAGAEAEWFAARTLVLRATFANAPDVHPGLRLRLPEQGAAARLGSVITRAEHRFDALSGHLVEVTTEPPETLPAGSPSGLLWGIVSRVDPTAMRVKVRLPTLADVETDWLPVLAPGGGPETGLLVLPHLEDSVLVAHTHDDSGRAVVLGGIFGAAGPGLGPTEGELPFQLRSRRGHLLELDDAGERLTLEDHRGSSLNLHSSGIVVTARGDLELRAPGHRIVIAAARVDFEHQVEET